MPRALSFRAENYSVAVWFKLAMLSFLKLYDRRVLDCKRLGEKWIET